MYNFENEKGDVTQIEVAVIETVVTVRRGNASPGVKREMKGQRKTLPLWPVDFEAVEALRKAEEQLKENNVQTTL